VTTLMDHRKLIQFLHCIQVQSTTDKNEVIWFCNGELFQYLLTYLLLQSGCWYAQSANVALWTRRWSNHNDAILSVRRLTVVVRRDSVEKLVKYFDAICQSLESSL